MIDQDKRRFSEWASRQEPRKPGLLIAALLSLPLALAAIALAEYVAADKCEPAYECMTDSDCQRMCHPDDSDC